MSGNRWSPYRCDMYLLIDLALIQWEFWSIRPAHTDRVESLFRPIRFDELQYYSGRGPLARVVRQIVKLGIWYGMGNSTEWSGQGTVLLVKVQSQLPSKLCCIWRANWTLLEVPSHHQKSQMQKEVHHWVHSYWLFNCVWERVLHSHGYLLWQITPSTLSDKPAHLCQFCLPYGLRLFIQHF